MSELWRSEILENAMRVPPWVRQGDIAQFRAWTPMGQSVSAPIRMSNADHDPGHVHEPMDLQTRAFAEGFEEGRRAVEEVIADERAALAQLIASLEVLKPQPSQGLAMLLAETVERLVRQIMGEVAIDRETLIARAERAAELVSEDSGAMRLRLHPEDHALIADAALDIPMVADPHLLRGTIMLETDEGWIEDGPEARLEKLRAALDSMGLAGRDEPTL